MADWVNIPETSVEPGAPARSNTVKAFRDNPIAITEGAAGAPRIQTAAIANGAVNADRIQPPSGGTGNLIARIQESEIGTNSIPYPGGGLHRGLSVNRHLGVICLIPGTITCHLEHRMQSGVISHVRVLRNGSEVQSWSTSSTSFVTRQVNVSVSAGDLIIFQNRVSGSAGNSNWRRLRIYSNNPTFAVA